jgi:transposase
MEAREQRGIIIAAMCRIDRKDGAWLVPSQTAPDKKYLVKLDGEGSCTCPDCTESGFVCKHIRAVRISLKRELGMDGSIVETRQLLFEETRVYTQDWPAYNTAQATEKKRMQVLLADLCRNLPEEDRSHKTGPRPHLTKDAIFAMVFKVYSGFSSRRFSTDLAEAHEKGHTSRCIPGMKVNSFFENPKHTPILVDMIAKSAAPLAAVESDFAVDSSGFASTRYETWRDEKYGVTRRKCQWVKAHIACGVKTNVVTAVRILDKDAADCPQLAPLVKKTAESFKVSEVSADKAYASFENYETVAQMGGTGFLAFKSNHTGGVGGLFEKMLHYFRFQQAEFLAHYHKRSNVESTFSAVKRVFGDSVRSKTDVAMVNEVLCKFLAHNLCCLIHEQEKLGIEPVFWKEEENASVKLLA